MEWSFQIEGFSFQIFYCVNYWREGAFSRGWQRGAEVGFKRVRGFFGRDMGWIFIDSGGLDEDRSARDTKKEIGFIKFLLRSKTSGNKSSIEF
jgi:hypothetical protein